MTRGIAPLLLGYLAFDPDVRIEGVILNKTGGARHESKLRQAVETYTGVPVLGAVGYSAALDISERHLGLTTPAELAGNSPFMEGLARRIRQQVDIEHLRGIAGMAPVFGTAPTPARSATGGAGLKIGYARDEAFSFYYADDLEAFAANGATLVPIDMLRDRALPNLDGLFLGGGFPETQIEALAANAELRESVRMALEAGLPCHAECGGLMYLCRSITWRGETRPMAGFLDADAMMHSRPQGRGIVHFTPTRNALWHPGSGEGRAHEFHYASLENLSAPVFARTITRGHGIDGAHDGLVKKNTQAGFVHLRHAAAMPWVTDFLAFIRMQRKDGQKQSPARKERGRASSGA